MGEARGLSILSFQHLTRRYSSKLRRPPLYACLASTNDRLICLILAVHHLFERALAALPDACLSSTAMRLSWVHFASTSTSFTVADWASIGGRLSHSICQYPPLLPSLARLRKACRHSSSGCYCSATLVSRLTHPGHRVWKPGRLIEYFCPIYGSCKHATSAPRSMAASSAATVGTAVPLQLC